MFGPGEGDGSIEFFHFCSGQRAADDHAGAFNESARFHPFGLGGQGFEVAHGVRDHGLPDALGPVQPGQRVNPVHHAFTGAQGPPELVHDDEVVPARFQAGVRQGVGDLDGGKPC
ncbi:hypothetical protein D9M69_626850 [compost metagenome]